MFRYEPKPDGSRKRSCGPCAKASLWLPAVSLVAGLTFWASLQEARAAPPEPKPEPFKLTNIHFETNETACDMGIQISFDTEGITELSIEDPDDQVIYSAQSTAGMSDIGGQTEGFLEGVEPPVEGIGCEPDPEGVISVEDLFTAFPAGKYEFEGQGGGVAFEGFAILTHSIPAGPVITAPEPGTVVSADEPLPIEWEEVTGPIAPGFGPVQIVGYHIVVAAIGQPPAQLDVDVADDEFTVTVPAEFLLPGTVYEFEVLATDKGGNQTITEGGAVCTDPITEANCFLP